MVPGFFLLFTERSLIKSVRQPMSATHLAKLEMPEIGVLIFVVLACIPLFVIVHGALNRICFAHVARYCRSHDIKATAWRLLPSVDQGGSQNREYPDRGSFLRAGGAKGLPVYRMGLWNQDHYLNRSNFRQRMKR